VSAKARAMAERHRHTPMIGRTHGVHAEVMTLGLKFLGWHAELERDRTRVERVRETMRVGTISGAVGTCPHHRPEVETEILGRLDLEADPVASQVLARDRHAELMTTLAIVGASIERFTTEIRHLHRTEVREVSEGFARGQKGSSAMPHKRNPITAERLSGLARVLRANAVAALENVALWHERDITHSSVERIILPDSLILADYVLFTFSALLDRLDVDEERLARNLALTGGLVFSGNVLLALTRAIGNREEAYAIVQRHALACWNEGGTLLDRLRSDPAVTERLGAEELDRCFDASDALRNVDAIFERTLS
jgi:adenylosuccinate lyase